MRGGLGFVADFSDRLGRVGDPLFEPAREVVAPGPGVGLRGVWLLGPVFKPESADALALCSVVSRGPGLVAIHPTLGRSCLASGGGRHASIDHQR